MIVTCDSDPPQAIRLFHPDALCHLLRRDCGYTESLQPGVSLNSLGLQHRSRGHIGFPFKNNSPWFFHGEQESEIQPNSREADMAEYARRGHRIILLLSIILVNSQCLYNKTFYKLRKFLNEYKNTCCLDGVEAQRSGCAVLISNFFFPPSVLFTEGDICSSIQRQMLAPPLGLLWI